MIYAPERTNRFDVDVGKVADGRPLFLEELFVRQDNDCSQLTATKVGRPQRHDEVAQAEQRRLEAVRETADDDVVAQMFQHLAIPLVRLRNRQAQSITRPVMVPRWNRAGDVL